jgi:hypothetical protein
MNYRFLKLANLLKIAEVTEANQKLREEFFQKFKEKNIEENIEEENIEESVEEKKKREEKKRKEEERIRRKPFAIADQWYKAFYNTDLYTNWKNFDTLDAVLSYTLSYIRENKDFVSNKNFVSREANQSENKNLEYLKKKYPKLQDQISQLKPQFLSWLNSRFGENPETKEVHSIEDCLPTLSRYQEKLDSLKAKFNDDKDFKNVIIERFGDINISIIKNFTVDDMEKIMAISERKKGIKTIIPEGYIPNEYIGKFGEWNLWMPLTREDSIAIPGFDPDTLKPHTTWCTARTTGSNLFYSYSGGGTILFYAIKDDPNPEDDNAYQSIGWDYGEVQYRGDGTETVNRANKGMYEEDHRALFGSAFDAIYEAMENEVEQLGGQHPVAEKIEEAAFGDQEVYKDLIRGVEPDGVRDIDEVVREKRIELAENPSIPLDNLREFSKDKDARVRRAVASNESTPPDVLRELSGDEDEGVRAAVASNESTPQDILRKLSGDESPIIREGVAKNPLTPQDILRKLSGDKDYRVRAFVAENPSAPQDVVEKLLEDPSESVRLNAKKTLKKLQEKQASTKERRFNKIARYLRISNLKN